MLSGIGPARHLRDLGVDVAWDLPGVGANLRDHPTAVALWPVVHGATWPQEETADNRQRYADQRRGPLASLGEAGGFLRCGENAPAPDVELTPMVMHFTGGAEPTFTCLVTLLTPQSRGTLRLRSTDPSAKPVLDPRYLDREADHDLLVEGLRRTLALCSGPVMRVYLGEPVAPDSDTDEALSRQVRDNLISMNHPAGTCRAGTDVDSVVDATLKVHGIDGLHVVDSSVMPDLPRGNTHAPSIMIGERGSDLILGDP
jgi:choline dehydrogenase